MSEVLHLLLVEDSEDDASLAVMSLEDAGLTLDWKRVASAGALSAALEHRVDAIIADYNVPGLDVRDTIASALSLHPDIPIIVVSGSMEAETGVELMRLGAQDYLSKGALLRLGPALHKGLERAGERARLRAAETTYKRLFEQLPVGVSRNLPSGETLDMNPALLRILGFPDLETYRAESTLTNAEFVPAADRAILAARLAAEGVVSKFEVLAQRRDGVRRWIRLDISAERDAGGTITTVDTVVTDIDDRKRSQAALQVAHDQLGATADTLRQSDAVRQGLLERLITSQEEERHRIALDIHDDAVQVMAASSIRLVMLGNKIADPQLSEEIKVLVDTVTESTGRLRNLMFELEPPGLERHGLVASIRKALEIMTADTGIAHTLIGELEHQPSKAKGVMIYRILQEGLANIRKHSKASNVAVVISNGTDAVSVSITDDGVGFVPSGQAGGGKPGHLGLASMRERTGLAGGTWSVVSSPGSGARIEFEIPLAELSAVPRSPSQSAA
ncbi:MAG: ATP-binding protein [Candidatus Dormibacteria bacterium]